jgi:hypothetical protein
MSVYKVSEQHGDSVTVGIELNDDPGIASLCLGLSYDPDVFELQNDLFADNIDITGVEGEHSLTDKPGSVALTWVNTENWSGDINGNIAEITFKVLDADKKKDYPLIFIRNDGAGFIAVCESGEYSDVEVDWPRLGDCNNDGRIDAADVTYLKRAIAGRPGFEIRSATMDCNMDTRTDAADVTYLKRSIAGRPGFGL